VFTFTLPPLRQRREDIPAIAEFLLRRHADPNHEPVELTDDLCLALQEYNWPGNIRELGNVIRRLTLLRDPNLAIQELRNKAAQCQRDSQYAETSMGSKERFTRTPTALVDLKEVSRERQSAERDAILSALNVTHWNRKQAARLLKVDYKALLYRIKKLSIDKKAPIAAPWASSELECTLPTASVVPDQASHSVPRVMVNSHGS
jgi:two-component system response regulator AtoC